MEAKMGAKKGSPMPVKKPGSAAKKEPMVGAKARMTEVLKKFKK